MGAIAGWSLPPHLLGTWLTDQPVRCAGPSRPLRVEPLAEPDQPLEDEAAEASGRSPQTRSAPDA